MMTHDAALAVRPVRSRPIPPPWPYDAAALAEIEKTVLHSQVARHDRRQITCPCTLRFLNASDLEQLSQLYDVVLRALPHPHILRAAGASYLARHIDQRGRCIGAFCEGPMVAFTVLTFPRDDPDNLGIDLGYDRETRMRSCHLELSGVHPEFRGSHLHRTMNTMRAEFAVTAGYHYLYGTVSPRNPYSLQNHLAHGMLVRKLVTKYGGMDRFVIHRNACQTHVVTPEAMAAAQYRPCLDIAGQKALLDAGYWGVSLRQTELCDWELAYVPSRLVAVAETTP